MGLDVMIRDFLYGILAHSILHPVASADAVFSILSLPRVSGISEDEFQLIPRYTASSCELSFLSLLA